MRRSSSFALPLLALSLLSGLAALSCDQLDTLEPGICGNGVIDGAEVCDGHKVGGFDCIAAGEPWQCAFACSSKGACPDGFGCGTDSVCRRATGTFEDRPFADVASQAHELLSGDFDADGRQDVVGVEPGRLRISFFGDTGVQQQATIKSKVRPGIGKLAPLDKQGDSTAADATDDLSLVLDYGIGAMVSQGDRSFAAHTYGSITFGEMTMPNGQAAFVGSAVPVALDALPQAVDKDTGDETGALVTLLVKNGEATTEVKDAVFVAFAGGGTGVVFLVPDFNYEKDHAGPPVQGDIDPDVDPCQEIAFPRYGATSLTIYKTCKPSMFLGYDWGQIEDPTFDPIAAEISLPTGTIAGPASIFDVDGDGHLDVILTVDLGGIYELEVAYGFGDGTFGSAPPAANPFPDNQSGSFFPLVDSLAPLFIGDATGDGLPDIVTALQVLRGGYFDGSFTLSKTYTSTRPWTAVAVADVNADGHPDIAACQEGAPDIDLLMGNSSDFYNLIPISTDGTLGQLVAGDFDGDTVQDLAFQNVISSKEQLLMMAFGRTSGGPEEPVEVGTFKTIRSIVQGNVHIFGVDNITDLGIVSTDADDELALSFLPGAGNRVLQTPFLLSEPTQNRVQLPLQSAVGFLQPHAGTKDDPAHNDVAALSIDPIYFGENATPEEGVIAPLTLWGLFGTREADFEEEDNVSCTLEDQSILFPGLQEANVVTISKADVGSAGRVFVATPVLRGEEFGTIVTEAFMQPGGGCELQTPSFAGNGKILVRMRTADLDRNGEPEILALMGDIVQGTETQLVVFWDGELGGETLTPYVPPDQPGSSVDFATGDIDGDGLPEVVALTSGGPVTYSLGAEPRTLVAGEGVRLDIFDAQAIAITDADGDGVNDIAVASGSQLQVYRGVPLPEVVNPPQ